MVVLLRMIVAGVPISLPACELSCVWSVGKAGFSWLLRRGLSRIGWSIYLPRTLTPVTYRLPRALLLSWDLSIDGDLSFTVSFLRSRRVKLPMVPRLSRYYGFSQFSTRSLMSSMTFGQRVL